MTRDTIPHAQLHILRFCGSFWAPHNCVKTLASLVRRSKIWSNTTPLACVHTNRGNACLNALSVQRAALSSVSSKALVSPSPYGMAKRAATLPSADFQVVLPHSKSGSASGLEGGEGNAVNSLQSLFV